MGTDLRRVALQNRDRIFVNELKTEAIIGIASVLRAARGGDGISWWAADARFFGRHPLMVVGSLADIV